MKKIHAIAALFIASAFTAYATGASASWEEHCAKCHGADGKGGTKMGKKLGIRDLTDAKVQESITDEAIVKSVKEGVKDASGKSKMKAIEGLSDDEVQALVPVVRGLKQ